MENAEGERQEMRSAEGTSKRPSSNRPEKLQISKSNRGCRFEAWECTKVTIVTIVTEISIKNFREVDEAIHTICSVIFFCRDMETANF